MCIIDGSLKLCTCSGKIDTKQPHWRLYRKTIIQPVSDVMTIGLFALPIFSVTEDLLIEQLNQRNCFDFNYQPLDEDKLLVQLSLETLEFEYDGEDSCWRRKAPTFEETKRRMQAKGYIKNNAKTAF